MNKIRNILRSHAEVDGEYYASFVPFLDMMAQLPHVAAGSVAWVLASILLASTLIIGDLLACTAMTISIITSLLAVLSAMPVFGIYINPISIVNLVASLGLVAEFSAHITYHFVTGQRGMLSRMYWGTCECHVPVPSSA